MRAHLVVLGLVLAAACGSDTGTAPKRPPLSDAPWGGTYTLKAVNGQRLPYTWSYPSGSTFTLTGRTIYVYSDHTWSSLTRYSNRPGVTRGDSTYTQTGTWARTDPEGFVSLSATDGAPELAGTAMATLLRLSDGFDVYDYSR